MASPSANSYKDHNGNLSNSLNKNLALVERNVNGQNDLVVSQNAKSTTRNLNNSTRHNASNVNNFSISVNNRTNNQLIDSQLLMYNKIDPKKKIDLTHQFFTLSLLEYICNLLNPNDRQSADIQFNGKY